MWLPPKGALDVTTTTGGKTLPGDRVLSCGRFWSNIVLDGLRDARISEGYWLVLDLSFLAAYWEGIHSIYKKGIGKNGCEGR